MPRSEKRYKTELCQKRQSYRIVAAGKVSSLKIKAGKTSILKILMEIRRQNIR